MSKTRAKALVIGGGVSGLTTALCLRQDGMDVTVVAERFAPNVTSVVAGALWEWPPAVCGYHHDELSLARSKEWCMVSYRIFIGLAEQPETGVHFRPVVFYFKYPVGSSPRDLEKMTELRDKVLGFRHDAALIRENGVNTATGVQDAYAHMAPMVDTDRYMAWLLSEAHAKGCDIRQGRITGRLRDQEGALKRRFRADVIVNCSGLGAAELSGEPMYALRGALVRVKNDGVRMPRITQAHCVSHDESRNEQDIVFIVPRGTDMLVLGGLAERDEWSTDIGLHNYEPVRAMYRRCVEFLPALAHAEIDAAEPVRVGLRPFRARNVRVDREEGTDILHNYAHGGAGVTFSWGCAFETAALAQTVLGGSRSSRKIASSSPATSSAAST